MTAQATYDILIDWDNDGGLNVGNFEGSLDSWAPKGTNLPSVELTANQFHLGSQSAKMTWTAYVANGGADTGVEVKFDTAGRGFDQGRFAGGDPAATIQPSLTRVFVGLVPGRTYTYSGWVYVPSSGGVAVQLTVDGIGASSASNLTDQWQNLSMSFVAKNNSHTFNMVAAGTTVGGEVSYFDEAMILGPGERVSNDVLGVRTPLSMVYGRDQARSLGAVQPGDISIELNNRSRAYSPDNPGSVIAGYLSSGKPIIVKATYQGLTHVLFNGFLNAYQINPDRNSRSVTISALDVLSKLNGKISTAVYPVLRSGAAVHVILDQVSWPIDQRDIDPGASILPYWCEDGVTGIDALARVMNSEGPPSFAYVDFTGNFVFRDRHHRILEASSVNVQAVFRDDGPEPTFSAPMTYNIGWDDIINSVDLDVDQREPGEYAPVFESDDTINIAAGQTYTASVTASDMFIGAITPVAGTDFTLDYGTVNVVLSRDSGKTIDIKITATSNAQITGLSLRARPVTAARTYRVTVEDPGSIAQFGLRSFDGDIPWPTINDVQTVARIIVGMRSQRLPVVEITLKNANATRLGQILSRDLSDRVHITETETFTDDDYYIERIEHNVADVGADHTAKFSCERVRSQPASMFMFNDANKGFDKGLFGYDGLDSPTTVFILDVSALDTGLLGT